MSITGILLDGQDVNKPALRDWLAAREIVSVLDEDYGALGDGSADDHDALDLAFAETGKSVWLPKGNYKTTEPLTPPVCARIYG